LPAAAAVAVRDKDDAGIAERWTSLASSKPFAVGRLDVDEDEISTDAQRLSAFRAGADADHATVVPAEIAEQNGTGHWIVLDDDDAIRTTSPAIRRRPWRQPFLNVRRHRNSARRNQAASDALATEYVAMRTLIHNAFESPSKHRAMGTRLGMRKQHQR
jgi:hypothetical protein